MPEGGPQFEPAKAFGQGIPSARPGANIVVLTPLPRGEGDAKRRVRVSVRRTPRPSPHPLPRD